MFKDILQQVQAYDRIIIHRHSKPDGDAIGSQIGLKHLLKENFPDKEIYVVGDPAGRYDFIEDSVMDEIPDSYYSGALAFILDSGSRHLVSDDRYTLAACTIRFDHHLFIEKFADYEAIDSSYESCCGIITAFAMECDLKLNTLAASALYTGMVTDSGRFRYDSTTAQTFRLAAHLMEASINTEDIFRKLYAEDYESKKRKAAFILKVRFTEHNVAYIYTTAQEIAEMQADPFSISRAMVGTMADTKNVDIWANFTEDGDSILCELRSSRFNINSIAVKYGGGGHAKASGATLQNMEQVHAMLADLDQMIVEGNKE